MWWNLALWGLLGGALNRAVVFLEALNRIQTMKKATQTWPWERPLGPGGRPYIVGTCTHLAIAFGVTAALVPTGYLANGFYGFVAGAGAVTIAKKATSMATELAKTFAREMLKRDPDDDDVHDGATP